MMGEWKIIETAPRDGKTIFAEHWQTGQRGMVHFNSQGEWEMVNGLNNSPMGIGFYPTHWMHLPAAPGGINPADWMSLAEARRILAEYSLTTP